MTYSVHFVADLSSIPDATRIQFQRIMQQIAEAVGTIAPASPFWSSVHTSVLQIDVAGFRLMYRILQRSLEIHVVEVTAIRPPIKLR